jgi:branched-subunit amino acid transport protein AzlD
VLIFEQNFFMDKVLDIVERRVPQWVIGLLIVFCFIGLVLFFTLTMIGNIIGSAIGFVIIFWGFYVTCCGCPTPFVKFKFG